MRRNFELRQAIARKRAKRLITMTLCRARFSCDCDANVVHIQPVIGVFSRGSNDGAETGSNRSQNYELRGESMKIANRLAGTMAGMFVLFASVTAWAAAGQPEPWQMGLQDAASPVADGIH